MLDLDVLGFIDHSITVNIVRDGKIVEKKPLSLPKKITNVIRCKNPRCITSIEQGLDQVFYPGRRGKRDLSLPVLRREIPSFQKEIILPKKMPAG